MAKKNAAIAYLPVYGWFFALFFGSPDDTVRFHGRQGLGALLTLAAGLAAVWVISRGFIDYLLLFWLEDALYGAVAAFYLFLLVRGAVAAVKGESRPLPLIGKRASRLPV